MAVGTHYGQVSLRNLLPVCRKIAERHEVVNVSVSPARLAITLKKVKSAIYDLAD
jgi:hypothetical protein